MRFIGDAATLRATGRGRLPARRLLRHRPAGVTAAARHVEPAGAAATICGLVAARVCHSSGRSRMARRIPRAAGATASTGHSAPSACCSPRPATKCSTGADARPLHAARGGNRDGGDRTIGEFADYVGRLVAVSCAGIELVSQRNATLTTRASSFTSAGTAALLVDAAVAFAKVVYAAAHVQQEPHHMTEIYYAVQTLDCGPIPDIISMLGPVPAACHCRIKRLSATLPLTSRALDGAIVIKGPQMVGDAT